VNSCFAAVETRQLSEITSKHAPQMRCGYPCSGTW